MLNSILADKAIPLIETNTCLATKENQEQMIDLLMQIKHFYTLIRYESQKQYLIEFMKSMQFKKTQRGTIIYEKGIQNEGLYLVLKGTLSLWEPKTQGEINNEIGLITKLQKFSKFTVPTDDMKKKIYQTQFQLDFFRKKQDDELFKHQDDQHFLTENICSLKRIRNVHAGDSLNDDCVVSGQKTQYTVMSMDDCYLLFISSRDYLRIFDLEINKLNFILEVLKKNFNNSKIDSLRRISYKFKEEVFPYGSMIFHQDDPSNILMIVHSGSVEISKITFPGQIEEPDKVKQKKIKEKKKKIDIDEKNIQEEQKQNKDNKRIRNKKEINSTLEDEKTFMEYQKYYGNNKGEENDDEDEDFDQINMERIRDEEQMKQKKKRKGGAKQKQQSITTPVKYFRNSQCLKLGIVGSGEVLGLEDFIKHKKRSFQAQSVSADTLIYYVSKKKIDDIIDLNEDFNLKKAMKQNGNVKIDWYSDQQNKISKVNLVYDQKNEEISTALSMKQIFANQEDINFKSVVKKLFSDRRTKLVEDMIRKEEIKSPIRIKNFPSLNNPFQTIQNEEERYQNNQDNCPIDNKVQIVSQIFTPIDSPRREKASIFRQDKKENVSSVFQDNSQLQQDSTQHIDSIAQISSQQIIGKQNINVLSDTHLKYSFSQLQSQSQMQSQSLNSISSSNYLKFKKLSNAKFTQKDTLAEQQQQCSEKQIKSSEIDKQAEYENRFRTIMYSPESHQKRISTEPSKKSVEINKIQLQDDDANYNLEKDEQSKSKNKKEPFRNYQLETASLSLQQKIMYKIKNNILLSQKYEKYNAENSRGFLETKKVVKRLRQSQQSKSEQQINILKNMREVRQQSINQILLRAQNSQSMLQIYTESDQPGITTKRAAQQTSLSRTAQQTSLSQINDLSLSIIKPLAPFGSHTSFIEEEEKEKQKYKYSQFPVACSAIISSISPNNINIKNKFKNKQESHNKYHQAHLQNIEDRLNSIQHFQSPQSKHINKVISFTDHHIAQNHQYEEQTSTSAMSNTEPTYILEKKSQFLSQKKLDSLNEITEQNTSLNTNQQNNKSDSLHLPQLINPNQSITSLVQSIKSRISPQISFSVKMSRKNINQKFQDIYANNSYIGQKSKTDREDHNIVQNNDIQQSLITISKLDVADDIKSKIQIRQQRQSSFEENKMKNKFISIKRFKQNGKYGLQNRTEIISNMINQTYDNI